MSTSQETRIGTERIWLQQVPIQLAELLATEAAEPPSGQQWADGYPLYGTRVAARAMLRCSEENGPELAQRWGMFRIILRETGEVIGDIGYHGPPDEAGTAEIGYGIVSQHRGRGLVIEACAALCTLSWSRPELNRLIAHTVDQDDASAGVLLHVGFQDGPVADGHRSYELARPNAKRDGR